MYVASFVSLAWRNQWLAKENLSFNKFTALCRTIEEIEKDKQVRDCFVKCAAASDGNAAVEALRLMVLQQVTYIHGKDAAEYLCFNKQVEEMELSTDGLSFSFFRPGNFITGSPVNLLS